MISVIKTVAQVIAFCGIVVSLIGHDPIAAAFFAFVAGWAIHK